jgi:hypothetical protein
MCTVHVDRCHTYWYEIIKSIVIYCGRKCNTPILITPFLVLKVLPSNNRMRMDRLRYAENKMHRSVVMFAGLIATRKYL